MARVRMVTRTIESTKVTAMTVNVATQEVKNEEFVIAQTFANAEKLLKAVKKQCETDEVKVVAIVSDEVQQKMYGMLETEFLANAHELDENRKIVGTDIEAETDDEKVTE